MRFNRGFSRQFELSARKKLIEHILKTEKEVIDIVQEAGDYVVKELERLEREGKWMQARELLDTIIQQATDHTSNLLERLMTSTLEIAVEAGTTLSKEITLHLVRSVGMDTKPIVRSYFQINEGAVSAMESRVIKGLNLSHRIWSNSRRINQAVGTVVRDTIYEGGHAIDVAKRVDKYVQTNARTLVSQYPNMDKRIGHMIPNDVSYEAVRLARTEMMAAYGEATKRAIEKVPSEPMLQWYLSNAGVACQDCIDNSLRDVGNGKGVYKQSQLPTYPAHPNCMCQLTPVLEDGDDLVRRLKEWQKNPAAHPDIEAWYNAQYKPYAE